MATDPETPLGHSTPSHHVLGWCSHCPGRSVPEELAAWQVDAQDRALGRTGEMEQLRTKNERMRHELEVMYGGAFDTPPAQTVSERLALVEALVSDFVDPDPCWFDHHGYCQAHGWAATDPLCPHGRAKALGLEETEEGNS